MRNHDGHVGFASDADGFLNRGKQADGIGTFIAHVRVVDAAICRSDFGEGDNLIRAGVAARCVVKARRHADRAFLHAAVDQRLHGVHLRGRGCCVRHAQDGTAH